MKIRKTIATTALTGALLVGTAGAAFAAPYYYEVEGEDVIVTVDQPEDRRGPGGGGHGPSTPPSHGPSTPSRPVAPELPSVSLNPSIAWTPTAGDSNVGTERVLTVSNLVPGQVVTLNLTNPNGVAVSLNGTANADGVAVIRFTPTVAGDWTWTLTTERPDSYTWDKKNHEWVLNTTTVTLFRGSFTVKTPEAAPTKPGKPGHNRPGHGKPETSAPAKPAKPTPAPSTSSAAPSRPVHKHPVTGAATALYAIGGTVLAAGGSTVLVAKRRTR